jgi:N-sulfoglucosamine sulfohydrolase
MSPTRPNIVLVHSHDTGRYVQPYGYQLTTPNIQRLADQGLLFRQAFSASPTCSPSRAALLTGRWPHSNGMNGLAHRGFALDDPGQHILHTLRTGGYWTAMVGEQHVSADPEDLGYDMVVDADTSHAHHVAPAAVALLRDRPPQPFFLSVGFFETHRDYFEPTSVRDALYSVPPANLPDSPVTRRDMAAFKQSARALDHGVGAKSTLSDRGLGVTLIVRGPGGFHGGRVNDALVSQIDIFPTLCELVGIPVPDHVQGRSLVPAVRGEARDVNEAVYAELTYHAAYDPQRAIRTRRHKYVRRWGDRDLPVLPNIDDSPSKELLLHHGLAETPRPREELYDLLFDPNEAHNLVTSPDHHGLLAVMRARLERWMEETGDPLLDGHVPAPPGAEVNDPTGISAAEATDTDTGAVR